MAFGIYTSCFLNHISNSSILYLFTFDLHIRELFSMTIIWRYADRKLYQIFYNISAFLIFIINSYNFTFLTKLLMVRFDHFSFNFKFSWMLITSRNFIGKFVAGGYKCTILITIVYSICHILRNFQTPYLLAKGIPWCKISLIEMDRSN